MTYYMYDAAYSPDLAACKRHGAVAMSHYMTRSYAGTSPQPAAIRQAGMGVLFNWEGLADELVNASRAKGQQVGKEALAAIPAGVPRDGSIAIYFSVDVGIYSAPYNACDSAFQGINDVVGKQFQVRCYAEGAVINHLVSKGLVKGKQWLSASASFPGFDVNNPNVCLVQMHDLTGHWIGTDIPGTDRNTVTDPHALGAWWPTGSPYALGGGLEVLDPKDPELIEIKRILALIVHGDKTHPNSQDVAAPLLRAVNATVNGATGINVRVASVQAAQAKLADAVATLAADVKALKTGQVELAPLAVTGTLTIGATA